MIPLPRAIVRPSLLLIPLAVSDLAPTGTLRATFIGNNPVQGRVDAKTSATTGPCPDLVREFGRRRGVPVVVTPLADATAVIDSVKAGTADIGCLAIEAARATQVDFSDPYSEHGERVRRARRFADQDVGRRRSRRCDGRRRQHVRARASGCART